MIIIKFMLYTAATIGYLVWLRIHKAPQKASIYIILGGIVFFLLGIVSHILIGEQSWQEVLLINRITFSSRLVVMRVTAEFYVRGGIYTTVIADHRADNWTPEIPVLLP